MKIFIVLVLALMLISCGKKTEPAKEQTHLETPAKQVIDSAKVKPTESPTETSEPIAPELRQKRTGESPIKNKRWKLVELNGEKIELTETFRSEPYITLSLHSDKMTGSGGCNRFGCKYALTDESLSFTGFATTKIHCEDAMKVEDPFLRDLATVSSYRLDGDTMWLLQNGKRIMKFEAVYLN